MVDSSSSVEQMQLYPITMSVALQLWAFMNTHLQYDGNTRCMKMRCTVDVPVFLHWSPYHSTVLYYFEKKMNVCVLDQISHVKQPFFLFFCFIGSYSGEQWLYVSVGKEAALYASGCLIRSSFCKLWDMSIRTSHSFRYSILTFLEKHIWRSPRDGRFSSAFTWIFGAIVCAFVFFVLLSRQIPSLFLLGVIYEVGGEAASWKAVGGLILRSSQQHFFFFSKQGGLNHSTPSACYIKSDLFRWIFLCGRMRLS